MKDVIHFLRTYRDWVNTGAPDMTPFSRNRGLCNNIGYFYNWEHNDEVKANRATEKLVDILPAKFYPFNTDVDAFSAEVAAGTCWQNENRNNWVNQTIELYEKLGEDAFILHMANLRYEQAGEHVMAEVKRLYPISTKVWLDGNPAVVVDSKYSDWGAILLVCVKPGGKLINRSLKEGAFRGVEKVKP